ncbi:hypothetical protein [Salmonirosea aquatica]|uniref:hypothetical protein n=1 Tax=Salmonirosea aquatica TaxID=2654236 RepID=UPI003570B8AB
MQYQLVAGTLLPGARVPSILLELSDNILLHPEHPDFEKIKVMRQQVPSLDARLGR